MCFNLEIKWNIKKKRNVGKGSKSNRKIVERGQINTWNT